MLAQAHRAIGTNSVDRYVNNLGLVAQMKPDVLDKFDSDAWADGYADMLGVDPKLIVAGQRVAKIRQDRAEQQQAMAQQQAQQQAAENMAKLGRNDSENMQDILNQFSGYNSPSPMEV